jgi:hypothetical protein
VKASSQPVTDAAKDVYVISKEKRVTIYISATHIVRVCVKQGRHTQRTVENNNSAVKGDEMFQKQEQSTACWLGNYISVNVTADKL